LISPINSAFHEDVIWAANEEKVLCIITADNNKLTFLIEIENIDNV
jgi:hypothetical protein